MLFQLDALLLQAAATILRNTAVLSPPERSPARKLPDNQREVSVLRISDPTAVREANEEFDMDVINLDPENFKYMQVTVPLEDCSLIYQSTDTAMRTRSRIYEGFESCFVLGPNASGSIDVPADFNPVAIIAGGK